jgi:DNA-damage-inducible protein D
MCIMIAMRLAIPTDESFDAIRRLRDDDSEYWSARDLMLMLGYDKWQRFTNAGWGA